MAGAAPRYDLEPGGGPYRQAVEVTMCGIFGIIDLAGRRPIPATVLKRASDAMFHRGPDEEGFLRQPGFGFAARRLSIVGLADGQQPAFNETKTVSVIFNGEIFDHATWRHDLKARGHHLTTSCDTEVLPHLWEEYEEDLFAKLNGQFAVALFDERKQKFVLARDRFGICPLFWTRTTRFGGDWLVFGSEIKTILATGLVEPKPDRRGIDAVFNFLAVPGPFSCFEGINILPPGKMLTIARGRVGEDATISERAYWTMDFPDQGQETRGQDERAVVDEFERLLYGAVKRRLHADVPVASYLSGGVELEHGRRHGPRCSRPRARDVHIPDLRSEARRNIASGHRLETSQRRPVRSCLRIGRDRCELPAASRCDGSTGNRHVVHGANAARRKGP